MFDKYVISNSPDKIVHHEHRAPTDDSVRIYQEHVDKARAQVAFEHVERGNVFGSVVSWKDCAHCKTLVSFELNGQRVQFDIDAMHVLEMNGGKFNADSAMRVLRRAVADKIAAELMLHVLAPEKTT